jgi:hypothetical protein
MFLQYHRSVQNDSDKDEWGSQTEYKRWVRAAHWKTAGSNSIIRYTQAMIYSVSVLDLCDLESIGRKMPKGQGIDASVADGTLAPKHKSKKRSRSKKEVAAVEVAQSHRSIVSAIEKADEREAKMSALRMFLEFGSSEEKLKARQELALIAFRRTSSGDSNNHTSNDEDDEANATTSSESDDS